MGGDQAKDLLLGHDARLHQNLAERSGLHLLLVQSVGNGVGLGQSVFQYQVAQPLSMVGELGRRRKQMVCLGPAHRAAEKQRTGHLPERQIAGQEVDVIAPQESQGGCQRLPDPVYLADVIRAVRDPAGQEDGVGDEDVVEPAAPRHQWWIAVGNQPGPLGQDEPHDGNHQNIGQQGNLRGGNRLAVPKQGIAQRQRAVPAEFPPTLEDDSREPACLLPDGIAKSSRKILPRAHQFPRGVPAMAESEGLCRPHTLNLKADEDQGQAQALQPHGGGIILGNGCRVEDGSGIRLL